LGADEHAPRCAARAVGAQVRGERRAHLGWEREAIAKPALAADDDLPLPPAQVVELERHDLARAQAEAGQEQEDGVISASDCRGSVAGVEQPLDIRGGEGARHLRLAPLAYRRDARRQIARGLAAQEEEPQERAQRAGHALQGTGRPARCPGAQEVADRLRVERGSVDALDGLADKRAHDP